MERARGGAEQQNRPKIYTVGEGSQPFTGPVGAPESRVAGPRLEAPIRIRVITRRGRSVWGETINPDGTPGSRAWYAFQPGRGKGFV